MSPRKFKVLVEQAKRGCAYAEAVLTEIKEYREYYNEQEKSESNVVLKYLVWKDKTTGGLYYRYKWLKREIELNLSRSR